MLRELKKYRGVVFHDIRVMQYLRKNWLVVWKMTWGIWQISPEHSKMSKSELWWDPFVQSRKCMSLKLTEELCIMTMNNDTKTEEELTWVTSRVLTWALESLRNLYFNWLLVTKIYNAWATEELSFVPLKSYANFEEKLTFSLKNEMRNLANFHQST